MIVDPHGQFRRIPGRRPQLLSVGLGTRFLGILDQLTPAWAPSRIEERAIVKGRHAPLVVLTGDV